MERLSAEGEVPAPEGGAAAARFPDVRACLVPGVRGLTAPPLARFDWRALDTGAEAEVCLFRVAMSYRDAEGLRDWLVSQGFRVRELSAVQGDGEAAVSRLLAYWNVLEQGAPFGPEGPLALQPILSRSFDVTVDVDPATGAATGVSAVWTVK